ncbi:DUF4097 family beta strand repeat-containing protein [Brevibacterium sp. UMB1308A]|uniref:DUF4097 family beta strand repeat-containing protein n=1 Tax=Brevibacterium sp. UMB1308A TaxID=3050608 RepID=UPI00254BDC7C|nr:DUF4097 family beta strand repeat-containing protein [Brevibacterium sp. UMB1308A]MDK8346555.1 DUF4097 family beta strand repeat-containing protein [Brevibacterium sp. UMB1308B]MDK8713464.1 DUF4097 family beta strand repeat-containing protein [Brevibacterium sp. UMB1308A]
MTMPKKYTKPAPPLSSTGRILWRVAVAAVVCLAIAVPASFGAAAAVQLLKVEVVEKNMSFNPAADTLELTGENTRLHVVTTKGEGFIKYKAVGSGEPPKVETRTSDSADQVNVTHEPGNWTATRNTTVTIGVPEGKARNIQAEWKSGDVSIDEGTYQDVKVTSDRGVVHFDAKAKNVELSTKSGMVSASGEVKNFMGRARTGSVTVDELKVTGAVALEATSGAVTYEMHEDTQPSSIRAEAKTGAVDIEVQDPKNVPDGRPYAVEAQTQTGSKTVNVDSTDSDPYAIPVTASTKTGAISIDYTN